MPTFRSNFRHIGPLALPQFSGTRVMMMPFVIARSASIPPMLSGWRNTIAALSRMAIQHAGKVAYLTIDEHRVHQGESTRRPGLHVDGVFRDHPGAWGGGGGWSSQSTGALTISSHAGCRAWDQAFEGAPGSEGECEHLRAQCRKDCEVTFLPGHVYWFDGLCVHESMPQESAVDRQFVRLSLPSTAPWFEGYTVNPLGVLPTGPILSRRSFMDSAPVSIARTNSKGVPSPF